MSATLESFSATPFFPGQAEYEAEVERRYLGDTRWQDGPTVPQHNTEKFLTFEFFLSLDDERDFFVPFDEFEQEDYLLKTIPLRGLKHQDRKAVLELC